MKSIVGRILALYKSCTIRFLFLGVFLLFSSYTEKKEKLNMRCKLLFIDDSINLNVIGNREDGSKIFFPALLLLERKSGDSICGKYLVAGIESPAHLKVGRSYNFKLEHVEFIQEKKDLIWSRKDSFTFSPLGDMCHNKILYESFFNKYRVVSYK